MRAYILLVSVLSSLAAGESWTVPATWGEAEGNPVAVEGQPLWRFDRILPANPENGAAYVTAPWEAKGKRWFHAEGSQGGNPSAKVADGTVTIGVYGRGGGKLNFVKGIALVFIAPKDGSYAFNATIDVQRWEGSVTTQWRGLKRFKKGEAWSVLPISSEGLKPEKGNRPKPITASLRAGDELVLLPWHDGHYSGATVTLHAPTVTLEAEGIQAVASLPAQLDFTPEAAKPGARSLPPGSGAANVRDYGAKGDGVNDDTAAIQSAIERNRATGGKVVYLPAGTYLVSGSLSYGDNLEKAKFLTIQGEGRDLTTIRLKDSCPGFDQRKPVLSQFEGKTTGMAFNNCVYDLTIDVGSGNPGAVALEWMNNNSGSCERVRLTAGPDSGRVGFDLTRHEPGPGLIRDLEVQGFDYGVLSTQTCFSMTFESLVLKGQRKAGLRNNTQTLFVRRLVSENACPAVVHSDQTRYGALSLSDSELRRSGGGPATGAAIVCGSTTLHLRNVGQTGYALLVDLTAAKLPPLAGEATRDGSRQAGDWWPKAAKESAPAGQKPAAMLNLPVEETPAIPWGEPAQWAVVNPERLKADYDDSPAIQEALDWAATNGRTSLLVPGGCDVRFGGTIRVPAQIRRICGMDAFSSYTPDFANSEAAVWRIEAGTEPVLIERFFNQDFGKQHPGKKCAWIEHASQRPLVWAHGSAATPRPYLGLPASKGAKVFLDDLVVAGFAFTGQKVWMRQFNPESNNLMCSNDGGDLWVFGTKTECETGTWFATRGGGRTEILGGYSYPSWRKKTSPAPPPLFTVAEGSAFSAVFKEQVFQGYMQYPVTIRLSGAKGDSDLGRGCYLESGFVPLAGVAP